ncbi:MAG: murein biosynthesis integral membrane protein MurJ [Firmicutes bacterium]|nr:murein biosynthesis integral membrane protein MurJ [Bacillota bacterium]
MILVIGSIVSKIFGLIREFSMAAIFGTSAETDSWLMASIVPNLFYGLLTNTITNVVIPVLSGHLEVSTDETGADVYLDEAFTWTLVLSFVMVALGEILSRHLIHWVAPGFHGLRYRLAVVMVRIMLPAMPFMALGSLINGILQSRHIFVPSTVTPIIINVVRLFGIVVLGLWIHIVGVAIGFLLAQMLQLAYLIPTLAAQRIRLRLRFSASHPWTRQTLRLAWPFLASHGANVAGTIVDRIFASTLAVGRIAALNFSNVLSGLPITLLVNPLVAPLYTQLSQAFNQHDHDKFQQNLQEGFELVTVMILPLAIGFILLRVPIIRILYQHGHFNTYSTALTSRLLLFWAIGMPAQALGTLFSRGLFAQRVTRVTAWMGMLAIAVNISGDFLLIHPLRAAGLALATSVAAWCRTLGLALWLLTHGDRPMRARPEFVLWAGGALGLFSLWLYLGHRVFHLATLPFGWPLVGLTTLTAIPALALYLWILRMSGIVPLLWRRVRPSVLSPSD